MINEVAPPGFGHTKSDKKKGVKKGGTAAAFDRARKRGDFKGTKSQMFAIMWSQKNKGDKPHYKPGTDEKKKKYQDESFDIDKSAHKTVQKKAKLRNLAKGNENPNEKAAAEKKAGGPKLYGEGKSGTMKKLAKASALDSSDDPKKQDRARAMRVAADFKSWKAQERKGKVSEEVGVSSSVEMVKAKEKAKRELIQRKAVEKQKQSLKGYSSDDMPDEKSSVRKEELTFEGWKDKAKSVMKKVAGKKDAPKHDYGRDAGAIAAKKLRKKDHEKVNFLDPDD